MSTNAIELDRLTQRWERFRARRDAALATSHGWLSLTAFHWLPAAPDALPGLPGLWNFEGTTAHLTASPHDHLTLMESGVAVDGTLSVELADEESLTWVSFGTVVVELGMRAHKYMVRTRDSQSPVLTSFTAVPVFAYNPELVVTASFVRFEQPCFEVIETANPLVGGVAELVGEMTFELGGTHYTLAAEEGALGALVVSFYDASNGDTTSHWRKIELTRPRPDGSVIIDFNRAINYPSAFTDFGTCPAPVSENTLPIAIEAGEQDPRK